MRLYDLHRGQVTDVEPARRRLLRLQVAAPAAGGRADLGDLRTFVIGDLIRRNAERRKLVVQAGQDAGGADPADRARHWTAAGAVRFDGRDGPVFLDDVTARGLDPLALRLAFLLQPYRDELNLDWPALDRADQALRTWRQLVAEWATHPSRPLSGPHAAEVTGAFDNDLFTAGALVTLRALAASAQIPPGAKFETFAHLDQLLGLDLARDVGR
jgi:cysteinyl-tRNA synthetase